MSEKRIDRELGAKYFKHETLKERVFKYMYQFPKITAAGLRFKFPNANESTLRVLQREFRLVNKWGGYEIHHIRQCIQELFYVMKFKSKPLEALSKKERLT